MSTAPSPTGRQPHAPRVALRPRILVIGTLDTKADEMRYLSDCIGRSGGTAIVMDVGVLGRPTLPCEISNADVAAAAGTTLARLVERGDENAAMTAMALGAVRIAAHWHALGRFDGLLALGGTMGTDLALDVAGALPLDVPKVILSTIAHSHLIPPERISPDLMVRLWAGGLYGLNRICRSALAQAAGAAVGACLAIGQTDAAPARPVIGMTSLGSSALRYMKLLKPALEGRGYELAVFHTTGMGGRAFEELAARRAFVAVMDFSLQEVVNHLAGSPVTAGPDRLRAAGRAGIPQLVAPGATDMVDFPAWRGCPDRFEGRAVHQHNRLIASVSVDGGTRRAIARDIGHRLSQATGPTCLLLPEFGVEEWDREGQPLHDPAGLSAFLDEMPGAVGPGVDVLQVAAHINDEAFADAALAVFDRWIASGIVPRTQATAQAIALAS